MTYLALLALAAGLAFRAYVWRGEAQRRREGRRPDHDKEIWG